jgi:cation diffusion facilitator family transporter
LQANHSISYVNGIALAKLRPQRTLRPVSASVAVETRRRENARAVQRVVVAILVLNLVVAAAKALYGWLSGSLAVSSDALHSLLDAGSNIGALVVLRFASRPPDLDHPYGHRKIEILAAAVIGVVISVAAVRFAWAAIEALVESRPPPAVSLGGIALMGATLAVNVVVAVYENRRGKQLGSAFLVADAAHTASDVFVTVGVIASLALTAAGVARADAVAALVVMLVIAQVAWRILSVNIGMLLDRAMLPADGVRGAAMKVPGVVGVHRVRSRGIEGAVMLDLHVLVDGGLVLRDAHLISHAVEDRVRTAFPEVVDVTIHIEPDDEEDEGL